MFHMKFAVAMHEAMPASRAANLCLEDWLRVGSCELGMQPKDCRYDDTTNKPTMWHVETKQLRHFLALCRICAGLSDYPTNLQYPSTGSNWQKSGGSHLVAAIGFLVGGPAIVPVGFSSAELCWMTTPGEMEGLLEIPFISMFHFKEPLLQSMASFWWMVMSL